MLQSSNYYGGIALGSIVSGQFAGNPSFLPCDGADYLNSAYPYLDKTGLDTLGTNDFVLRTMPSSGIWSRVAGDGATCLAIQSSGTAAAYSVDNGNTWVAHTLPSATASSSQSACGAGKVLVTRGTATVTSFDLASKVSTDITLPATVTGAIYAFGLFLLFRNDASRGYYTSPDGATWTARTYGAASSYSIVHGVPNLSEGKLSITEVSFSGAGNGQNVCVTSDGIYWGLNPVQNTISGTAISPPYFVEFWGGQTVYVDGYLSRDSGLSVSVFANGSSSTNASVISRKSGLVVATGLCKRLGSTSIIVRAPAGATGRAALASLDRGATWSKDLTMPMAHGNSGINSEAAANVFPSVVGARMFYTPSAAGTGIMTLDVDSTRFRTPYMPCANDGSRYFIKAA